MYHKVTEFNLCALDDRYSCYNLIYYQILNLIRTNKGPVYEVSGAAKKTEKQKPFGFYYAENPQNKSFLRNQLLNCD